MSTSTSSKQSAVKSSNTVSRKAPHKPLTFNTYIHKTLKDVQPDINIAKVTSVQLNVFIKIFSAKLSAMAIQIAHEAVRHTVSVEDVETAVKLLLQGDLRNNAVEQAQRAVDAYENSETSETKNKAARSGLSFPPHISEKFLRLQSSAAQSAASKLSVAQRAPIYMAAVIEYLVAQMLESGGKEAVKGKRQTITVRHLYLATHTNENIFNLLNNLNVDWLGGGVVPYVHPVLIPSKEKQRKLAAKRRNARKENGETPAPDAENPKRARKSLPGTKAMRDIKRAQKSVGSMERKEHFKRFVKAQAEEHWSEQEKVHFGAGVMEYLQLFIEDKVVQVFRESVRAMAHAGRETVELRDIEFVWSFMKPSGVDNHTDSGLDKLADPGLNRLRHRGGVKRISQACYPMIRDIMAFYVSRLLYASFLIMNRQKVKTITLHYLRRGASMVNINLPIDVTRRRTKKSAAAETTADADDTTESDSDEEVPLPEDDVETESNADDSDSDSDSDDADDADDAEGVSTV